MQVTIQRTAVDGARSTVQKATVIVKTVSASARLVCSEPRVICRVPMTLGVLTVYSSVAAMDRTVSAATQKYVSLRRLFAVQYIYFVFNLTAVQLGRKRSEGEECFLSYSYKLVTAGQNAVCVCIWMWHKS